MNNKIIAFLFLSFFSASAFAELDIVDCPPHDYCSDGHGSLYSDPAVACSSHSNYNNLNYSGIYTVPVANICGQYQCWGKQPNDSKDTNWTYVNCSSCPDRATFNDATGACQCNGQLVMNQGVCQCPSGLMLNPYTNNCEQSCPPPLTFQPDGSCDCPVKGQKLNPDTNICETPPVQCTPPLISDGAGNCISPPPEDECPPPNIKDPITGVCGPPQNDDNGGGNDNGGGDDNGGGNDDGGGDDNGGGDTPPGEGDTPPGDGNPNPVEPPQPEEPPKPDPDDNCPAGYVNLNGECVKVSSCPPGQHSVAGTCVADDQDPTGCPPGEVNINGTCLKAGTCPPGQYSVDGVCKPNDQDPTGCPPGEVNINGTCLKAGTCPPGQYSVDGVCKPNDQDPKGCPPGQVNLNGHCVVTGACPAGQHDVNGVCVPNESPDDGECGVFIPQFICDFYKSLDGFLESPPEPQLPPQSDSLVEEEQITEEILKPASSSGCTEVPDLWVDTWVISAKVPMTAATELSCIMKPLFLLLCSLAALRIALK